jgi:lipoprotein-anchoring transpeptidase ErfK/SrfK
VLPEGRAIRYGAIVGEDGQAWSGVATVARKEEWPGWTPKENITQARTCVSQLTLMPDRSAAGYGDRNVSLEAG